MCFFYEIFTRFNILWKFMRDAIYYRKRCIDAIFDFLIVLLFFFVVYCNYSQYENFMSLLLSFFLFSRHFRDLKLTQQFNWKYYTYCRRRNVDDSQKKNYIRDVFFVALFFVLFFTSNMSKVHIWRSFCSCHIRTSSWRSWIRVFREEINWNRFCSFEVALKARCVILCVSCINSCIYVSLLMLKLYNALRWNRFFKFFFKFVSFVRVWARDASSSRNVNVSMTKELSRELC